MDVVHKSISSRQTYILRRGRSVISNYRIDRPLNKLKTKKKQNLCRQNWIFLLLIMSHNLKYCEKHAYLMVVVPAQLTGTLPPSRLPPLEASTSHLSEAHHTSKMSQPFQTTRWFLLKNQETYDHSHVNARQNTYETPTRTVSQLFSEKHAPALKN